jgi:hypothetical protein
VVRGCATVHRRREAVFRQLVAQTSLRNVVSSPSVGAMRLDNVRDFVANMVYGDAYGRHNAARVDDILASVRNGDLFPPGRNPAVDTRTPNTTPLRYQHLPLLSHVFVMGVQQVCRLYYRLRGWHVHRRDGFLVLWRRPRSRGRVRGAGRPTSAMFFGGVGVGLVQNMQFLRGLEERYDQVLMFEVPGVRFNPFDDTTPTRHACVRVVGDTMRDFGMRPADTDVYGHSFGTIVMTYILHGLTARFRRHVFIEPVCLLVGYREFVDNLQELPCQNIYQFGIAVYLASLQLRIAVGRQFHWQDQLLLPADVPPRSYFVFTEHDFLVSPRLGLRHLDGVVASTMVIPGLDHGRIVAHLSTIRHVIRSVAGDSSSSSAST